VKVREFIKMVRTSDIDDAAKPYMWSDDELHDFAVDAQNEACRRGRLIVDSLTDRICRMPLTTEMHYKLSPRILFIRRVKLSDYSVPLKKLRLRDLDRDRPGWQTHTGLVRHWMTGFSSGYLTVYRKPDAVTYPTMPSIELTVVRLPLQDPGLDDEFEIHPRLHRSLRHWVDYRAYDKEDGDTYDPRKAANALALFEREFGEASPGYVEEFIDQNYDYEDDQGLY
jgi:hypothetical protein